MHAPAIPQANSSRAEVLALMLASSVAAAADPTAGQMRAGVLAPGHAGDRAPGPDRPRPGARDPRLAALFAKAAAGDPAAQNRLGEKFATGEDVGRDLAEAARWYRLAAEQGYAEAQLNLGELYENGRGSAGSGRGRAVVPGSGGGRRGAGAAHARALVARRPRRSGRLWRSGALVPRGGRSGLRHRSDQSRLHVSRRAWRRAGRRHGCGAPDEGRRTRPPGRAEQSRLFMPPGAACRRIPSWPQNGTRAASQGLANAQYQLGLLYERGEGVPRDDAAAARWYQEAARQGGRGADQSRPDVPGRPRRAAGTSARLRLAQSRRRSDESEGGDDEPAQARAELAGRLSAAELAAGRAQIDALRRLGAAAP